MTDGLRDNVLDVPSECLTTPTRLHVAIVEAVMLWPTDAKLRQKAIHASAVAYMRENRAAYGDDIDGLDVVGFAADAEPIANMSKMAEDPFVHGLISGFVLAETCGQCALAMKEATIGKNIELAAAKFWPKWKVSKQTINNTVWPKFKSVSHLWAAYWLRSVSIGQKSFPCGAHRLIDFLSEAQAIKSAAEATRTHKSRTTILPSGLAVAFPFELPRVEIVFIRRAQAS